MKNQSQSSYEGRVKLHSIPEKLIVFNGEQEFCYNCIFLEHQGTDFFSTAHIEISYYGEKLSFFSSAKYRRSEEEIQNMVEEYIVGLVVALSKFEPRRFSNSFADKLFQNSLKLS